MKKILLIAIIAACMTSCYNTRIYVGSVKPHDPVIEVSTQWNSQFLVGLIPAKNAKMDPKKYVDTASNYVVHTHTSFANGLVSILTCGIYTPTQTTYYIPVKDIKK